MKKVLSILGVIFVVIAIFLGAFISYAAVLGSRLDATSKGYVDQAIPTIVAHWSTAELLGRGSGAFRQSVNDDQLRQAFAKFSTLGKLISYGGSKGESRIAFSPQNGKSVTAQYVATAKFENGDATFNITLIQANERWQIQGFYMNSPILLR